MLDVAAQDDVDAPLAALLEPQEDVVLDLHVPGVVELGGLDDRSRGRGSVAAALELEGVEERPVGHVVRRVELTAHDVTRLEIHETERPGADGLEVGRCLA